MRHRLVQDVTLQHKQRRQVGYIYESRSIATNESNKTNSIRYGTFMLQDQKQRHAIRQFMREDQKQQLKAIASSMAHSGGTIESGKKVNGMPYLCHQLSQDVLLPPERPPGEGHTVIKGCLAPRPCSIIPGLWSPRVLDCKSWLKLGMEAVRAKNASKTYWGSEREKKECINISDPH